MEQKRGDVKYVNLLCPSDVHFRSVFWSNPHGTPQMCDSIALYSWEHASVTRMSNSRTETSKPVNEEAEEAWSIQPWDNELQEQLP